MCESNCGFTEAALHLHREGRFSERDVAQMLDLDRWALENLLQPRNEDAQ